MSWDKKHVPNFSCLVPIADTSRSLKLVQVLTDLKIFSGFNLAVEQKALVITLTPKWPHGPVFFDVD